MGICLQVNTAVGFVPAAISAFWEQRGKINIFWRIAYE